MFESMARLGSDEQIVKEPKWTSRVLDNEDIILRWLDDGNSSSYAPVIKVAQVERLVRRSMIIAKPEPEADAKLQLLLEESGWKDSSPEHARALVQTIDKNHENCKCPRPL